MFGTDNNFVGTWNIETTGFLLPTWVAHTSGVTCIKLLNTNSIVSGSSDKKLFVWNIVTTSQSLTTTFLNHTGAVTSVDKLPNGNVVSVGRDMNIFIWNPTVGPFSPPIYSKLSAHTAAITTVKVLPNGNIATAAEFSDNSVKIWNSTLGLIRILKNHTNTIKTIEVLANGNIISGSTDNYTIVWDPDTGDILNKFYAIGSGSPITCIKQLADGAISFAGNSTSIFTYRLTGYKTQNLTHTLTNAVGIPPCRAIMLYNSTLLAVSSSGNSTQLINVATSSSLFKIKTLNLGTPATSCLENRSNFDI